MQEYRQILRHPIPYIQVSPEDDHLYVGHFLITSESGEYAGGEYHGTLQFPHEYPMAPPRIMFFTPSGRFETNTKICVILLFEFSLTFLLRLAFLIITLNYGIQLGELNLSL